MPAQLVTPAGECPQCWRHANDRSWHAHLGWREDCQACIACKAAGHPGTVPKKPSGGKKRA